MKKIIVKAEVRDVDKLENRLMNLGYDFDPMYWQHSRIFVPRNYEEHNNFARMILRMDVKAVDRPARYSLICKRHLEKSKIDLVHETLVSSYAEAAKFREPVKKWCWKTGLRFILIRLSMAANLILSSRRFWKMNQRLKKYETALKF